MTRLILASGSPRRRTLLASLGLDFEVRPPDVDETLAEGEDADAAARRLAIKKAAATDAEPSDLVVAADTLVELDGEVLGKPADRDEAIDMLDRLAGRAHHVVTGIAIRHDGETRSAAARTDVRFRSLTSEEIAAYVGTGEPMDKAGAYGIQGYGAALVERIRGDFFNVMGLPVPTFVVLLREAGFRYLFGTLVRSAPPERAGSTGMPGTGTTER